MPTIAYCGVCGGTIESGNYVALYDIRREGDYVLPEGAKWYSRKKGLFVKEGDPDAGKTIIACSNPESHCLRSDHDVAGVLSDRSGTISFLSRRGTYERKEEVAYERKEEVA